MKLIERMRILIAVGALTILALPAEAEPALWHISDADSDIYLMGTVHVLPPGVSWRTPQIQQAFDSAETVWFEAPANDPAGQVQMVFLIQQYGLNPPGVSLSSRLSAETRETLVEFSTHTGIPMQGLEPLRPWLAAVTLTSAYAQTEGYDPASGVEAQLWPLANEQGKTLNYFETLEEQIRFFADLPEDVEIGLFEQTVMEYSSAEDELSALVEAWQNADLAAIDRLVNGEMRTEAPEIYEVVISQRNSRWVEKIQSLLEGEGTHFIALGAGHLAGEAGVIERLRSAGITVQGP